jgi:hypothetical protein
MEIASVLKRNLEEYLRYGNMAYREKNYNTAVVLFFKALVTLCDMEIFMKKRILPTNHTNRFEILRRGFPELYRMIDRDFGYYRDSYKLTLDKDMADLVRRDVERISERNKEKKR